MIPLAIQLLSCILAVAVCGQAISIAACETCSNSMFSFIPIRYVSMTRHTCVTWSTGIGT